MGQHNRQRRAAKQRQRAQQQGGRHPRHDHEAGAGGGDASALLRRRLGRLGPYQPSLMDEFRRCPERQQHAAVDEQFAAIVTDVITRGWAPLDLHEVVRRRTKSSARSHLLDVVAAVTARHPAHLIHPQWQAQLDTAGATVRAAGGGSAARDWARRAAVAWPVAVDDLLAVLDVVSVLPRIGRVLPAPGSRANDASVAGFDSKVLRRVRGLLAKAESTEHPAEADALNAKAQELMSRYSIERAMAESTRPAASEPVSRRLWLDHPYVDAKAALVEAVAHPNNCRTVQSLGWGFVTVVGHDADLDAVELLATALLVQATRAMTSAGSQVSRQGTSHTRSFRRSFLLSYALRIGQRLTDAAGTAVHDCDAGHRGELVPVLAARRQAVEDKVTQLFPDVVQRRLSVSNAAGWGAGRVAADLARLDVRESITRAG